MPMARLLLMDRCVILVQSISGHLKPVAHAEHHQLLSLIETFLMEQPNLYAAPAITRLFLFAINAANSVRPINMMITLIRFVRYAQPKENGYVHNVTNHFQLAKGEYAATVPMRIHYKGRFGLGVRLYPHTCPHYISNSRNG